MSENHSSDDRFVPEPSEVQQEILDAAAANPALTNAELARQTDTRISLVRDTLREFDAPERSSQESASDATASAESPPSQPDTATDSTEPTAVDDAEFFDEIDDRVENIDPDEAFETVDIDEIDTDAVWEELVGAEADAATFDDDPTGELTASKAAAEVGPQSTGDGVSTDVVDDEVFESDAESDSPQDIFADGEEALVDKRVYCQQCPYFSAPPAVHCDREGTTIVEVVSDGRFRLESCPVVTEDGPDRSYFHTVETPES